MNRFSIFSLLVLMGNGLMGQPLADGKNFALATPQLHVDSVFFQHQAQLSLELDEVDVEIRYTTDGTEVSENSPLYVKPLLFTESHVLKARAFHPAFQPSEVVACRLVRMNLLPEGSELVLSAAPHPNYPADGERSLIDGRKGTQNFRSPPHWLGFQQDSLRLTVNLPEPMALSGLQLSLLEAHGAWIFLPQRIEVWYHGKRLGEWNKDAPPEEKPTSFAFPSLEWEKQDIDQLHINIISLQQIPAWHGGAGSIPWLFIDELIINQD